MEISFSRCRRPKGAKKRYPTVATILQDGKEVGQIIGHPTTVSKAMSYVVTILGERIQSTNFLKEAKMVARIVLSREVNP